MYIVLYILVVMAVMLLWFVAHMSILEPLREAKERESWSDLQHTLETDILRGRLDFERKKAAIDRIDFEFREAMLVRCLANLRTAPRNR
jgi:hypothetical protein